MVSNLSPNPQNDIWTQALFNKQVESSATQTTTPADANNLPVLKESGIVNRVSLIPVDYKSKLPASHAVNVLVPLAGLFLAFGILGVGQYLIPSFRYVYIAPDDFIRDRAYSLISVPVSFLVDETKMASSLVGDNALSVLAVASIFPGKVVEAVDEAFGTMSTDTFNQPKILASGLADSFTGLLNKPVVDQIYPTEIASEVVNNPIEYNQLAAIGSLTGLATGFDDFITMIKSWSVGVLDFVIYYVDLISNNWYNFFFGPDEKVTANPIIDEVALREQIKAEVLADLKGTLAEAFKSTGGGQPVLIQDSGGQGVVVVPSSASTTDEAIKNQIKNLFSDPVLVDFDKSRQSGIITPVFNNTTGENYIFVLTPVKSN